MTKMRILITGGTGYIGSHTSVVLMEAGHEVAIFDNLSNSRFEVLARIERLAHFAPQFYKGDLRDQLAVSTVFEQFQPDAVVHFAGLKSVSDSVRQPLRYYDWNVAASLVLLETMQSRGVKKLVFSSSANVYGNACAVPIPESALIAPTNPYGRTKAIIEQMLVDIVGADNSWGVANLRYFNPMGGHPSGLLGEDCRGVPSNLPPYLSKVALGVLPELSVFGGDYSTIDGTGVRDYIHVMDLAEGHLAALNYISKESGVITANLGTGEGYSVLQLVAAFEQASGKTIPYKIVDRRPGDVAQSYADVSLAERLLGWKANMGLREMCQDAWRWQIQNPHGYASSL